MTSVRLLTTDPPLGVGLPRDAISPVRPYPWEESGEHTHLSVLTQTFIATPKQPVFINQCTEQGCKPQMPKQKLKIRWALCALHHGIQNSMDAILACHPRLSKNKRVVWQFRVDYDLFAQAPLDTCEDISSTIPCPQCPEEKNWSTVQDFLNKT